MAGAVKDLDVNADEDGRDVALASRSADSRSEGGRCDRLQDAGIAVRGRAGSSLAPHGEKSPSLKFLGEKSPSLTPPVGGRTEWSGGSGRGRDGGSSGRSLK